MRHTKFHIKNYKGIENLTIDLNKQPLSKVFTFVGLNESGKTTILEAIDLLEKDISEDEVHSLIPKNKKLNFNDTISVHADIELNAEDEKLIRQRANSLGLKKLEKIGSFTIERNYEFLNSEFRNDDNNLFISVNLFGAKKVTSTSKPLTGEVKTLLVNYIEELLPPILYYPDFLFEFPERIYLETLEDEEIDEVQETYRNVFKDILNTIDPSLILEDHIVKRMHSDKSGIKEALESTLDKVGEKITTQVFGAWEKLFASQGKEIVIKWGIDEEDIGYIQLRVKEKSNQYQISERSLGFRWFFSFLLFTEFRKNRAGKGGEILFLLDEPASNLHSTAQKKLLKTFEKIIDKSCLIYTTHSHHLINPNWLNGAFIIRNKSIDYNDEISISLAQTEIEAIPYKQFVSKYPKERDYFQPILDTLEYQPGLLESIPSIIITEGKTDYYIFKYLLSTFFEPGQFSLNFYPGSGANKNYEVIRLYLAWNRDFFILLDGDKAGIDAKKQYLKEFGKEVDGKIFSLEEINKDFNGPIEDLFSDNERLQIIKVFDNTVKTFDKSKFHTSIQNAMINKSKLNLSEKTLNKFEQIFKFLDSKISKFN